MSQITSAAHYVFIRALNPKELQQNFPGSDANRVLAGSWRWTIDSKRISKYFWHWTIESNADFRDLAKPFVISFSQLQDIDLALTNVLASCVMQYNAFTAKIWYLSPRKIVELTFPACATWDLTTRAPSTGRLYNTGPPLGILPKCVGGWAPVTSPSALLQ